jgi:hypothetical protein
MSGRGNRAKSDGRSHSTEPSSPVATQDHNCGEPLIASAAIIVNRISRLLASQSCRNGEKTNFCTSCSRARTAKTLQCTLRQCPQAFATNKLANVDKFLHYISSKYKDRYRISSIFKFRKLYKLYLWVLNLLLNNGRFVINTSITDTIDKINTVKIHKKHSHHTQQRLRQNENFVW